MKLLSILAILVAFSISNVQAKEGDSLNLSAATTGAVSWIALTVYAPEVAAGLAGTTALGYTSMSLGITALANQKAAIKNAVNSDAQEFFTNGNLSDALAQTIKGIKNNNSELSDAEALDLLVKSINE
jgi:hypothetical protein